MADFLREAVRHLLVLEILVCNILVSDAGAQSNTWIQSTGLFGGIIRDIKAGPQGFLFASSDCRMFRSTTNGNSWDRVSIDPIVSSGLGHICRDSAGNLFLGYEYGVLRSSDSGATWHATGPMPIVSSVRGIVSLGGGVMFAGTWRSGIFRSVDSGATWRTCTSQKMTAASFYFDREKHTLLAGSEGGVYRSIDTGKTWSFFDLGDAYVTDFLKLRSGALLASSSTSSNGLFQSTDEGLTWHNVVTDLRYCESMTITHTGRILVGSLWGIYASEDTGRTWARSGPWYEAFETLFCSGSGKVLAGTIGGGIYQSLDEGRTWTGSNNGIEAANISSIAADNQGYVYASSHRTIFSSSDHGHSFKQSYESSYAEVTTVSVDRAGRVYAIVLDTVFVSTDHGVSWNTACATGIWQPPWVLATDSKDNLFTATRNGEIYRSTNQGNTWNCVFQNSAALSASFVDIAFAPNDVGFMVTCEGLPPYGRIYRSTDDGASWVQIALDLVTKGIQKVSISPNGIVFIATNGSGLLRSTDNGGSWVGTGEGPLSSGAWVQSVTTCGNDGLFATIFTSYYSVYHSTDMGVSWFTASEGLPFDFVKALVANQTGYVFAGTQSNGLFYYDAELSNVSASVTSNNFSLAQNFPNPFNPVTTIRFTVPNNAPVRLEIFNVLGERVAILVDETKQAGSYWRRFDATGLSPGAYFYRLVVGGRTETRKLLLLK